MDLVSPNPGFAKPNLQISCPKRFCCNPAASFVATNFFFNAGDCWQARFLLHATWGPKIAEIEALVQNWAGFVRIENNSMYQKV